MTDTSPHMVIGNSAFSNRILPIIKKPESLKTPQIELFEIRHLGKLNIRCTSKTRDMVSKLTQCNLSLQPNQSDSKAGRIALCLGPDEYLILAERGSEIQLEKTLNSSNIIKQIAVTNVSDALCALSLSGKKARDLLAKGCPIDLHPDSFSKNQSAQCDLALANVILICLEEDAFICICRTSFAEYVLDWCLDAGFEFGISASAGI